MNARLTRWHNDHHQQNDDANDNAHPHLHVFPPHLLPHPVGAATEAVGLRRKVVGLVLQVIKPLATLGDLVNVVLHRLDSAIDFLCPVSAAATFQAASHLMRLRSQEARRTYTLKTLCARIAGVTFFGTALDIGVVETSVVVARHCCALVWLSETSGDRRTVAGSE